MTLRAKSTLWRLLGIGLTTTISTVLPQAILRAQPTGGSGLPEETLVGFVNQISDGLAAKIQNSTCPEAVALLDKIKEASAKPPDQDSIVGKVLTDVKTNPRLKAIIIEKVSGPMLSKVLECNMVPLDALGGS